MGRWVGRQILDWKELAPAALGRARVKSVDKQEAGHSGKSGCFHTVPSSLNMLREDKRTMTISKSNIRIKNSTLVSVPSIIVTVTPEGETVLRDQQSSDFECLHSS